MSWFDDAMEVLIGVTLVGLIAALVAIGVVKVTTPWKVDPASYPAKVKAMSFKAESTESGVGVGMTASGELGTVFTASTSPEQWNIVFALDNGTLFTMNDKSAFQKLEQGDRVTLFFKHRKLPIFGDEETELTGWRKN